MVLKDAWYTFYLLRFIRTCFATQHMFSCGESCTCAWEVYLFWWCWMECLHISSRSMWFVVLLNLLFLYLFSLWMILLLLKVVMKYYPLIIIVLTSSSFRALNALNIWQSNVALISSYNYCILFINWSLYHWRVTFSLLTDFDWMCILSDMCRPFCFLLITICMKFLFPSIPFQPLCALKLMCVF